MWIQAALDMVSVSLESVSVGQVGQVVTAVKRILLRPVNRIAHTMAHSMLKNKYVFFGSYVFN